MTKYKTSGTASIHLRTEFQDDGSDLYSQAWNALTKEYRSRAPICGMALEVEECTEVVGPTLGEIIKQKAARARAWMLGE